MRAITLTQPWASLVALGHKKVETRSWRTEYRGPIAIHAAKGFPKDAQHFASLERSLGRVPGRLPLACIVATAVLEGCRMTEDVAHQLTGLERHLGNYAPGRWAWFLSHVKPLPAPVPCRGALGLWSVSADLVVKIDDAFRFTVAPAAHRP